MTRRNTLEPAQLHPISTTLSEVTYVNEPVTKLGQIVDKRQRRIPAYPRKSTAYRADRHWDPALFRKESLRGVRTPFDGGNQHPKQTE
jgi:hypothetical protein